MKLKRLSLGTCATTVAMGCALLSARVFAEDALGWKTIPGGSGTGCATDATPYEFYVHEGNPQKIAVYYQGGGACWNSRNCGLDGRSTFEAGVNEADHPWAKNGAVGIFDLANPSNPIRGFTIIYAPYCSADVHIGVGSVRFDTADGKHLNVKYRGLANTQNVTDWILAHYKSPKQIFVSGGSAGAIPSPIFASQFAREYPKAKVVQLGDGAGGYRTARVSPILDLWGATRALKSDPLFRNIDATSADFEDFYSHASKAKNLTLAQVNSNEDNVQIFFMGELGHQVATLAPLLSGNLNEIRQSGAKLHSYVMPSKVHTILQRSDFYSITVDNIPLSKWVGDLVNGKKVGDVGGSLLPAPSDRLK